MPCCGDREKIGQMKLEQTWDYINLNDFKSSSCFTGFSYLMVWVLGLVSIAVYAVDTFTAVNLLAFNKWSSQIKPKIPINISRWIFAGAIIASFLLLIYRWIKAIRVMRSGGIAETYLDPLAVRVQSVRLGKHKGYRRFLVFAELTKSKKGADYIALFSYFSFEAWLRILLADGPRQVINAITLYSVMELELIPTGHNAAPEGTSPVVQFFINIKALAEKNYHQAVILFGMLFTLIIWVIAALSLALSVILYLIFLWHHIPTADGSLRRYCRRKINTRLERIVRKKTATALAKSAVQLQDRTPTIPMDAGAELKPIKLAPTLPSVTEFPEDKKPIVTVAPLSRQPTQSSLPPYSSDPGFTKDEAYRQPKLPDLADNAWLTKTNTQDSLQNESASLAAAAAPMGYSPLDNHYTQQNGHMPPGSFDSQYARSFSPAMDRPPTAQGRKDAFGQADRGDIDRYAPNSYQPRNQTPQAMMGRQTPGSFRDAVPRSYSPATDRSNERPYLPRMQTPSGRPQGPNSNVPGMRSASPAVPPLGLQQTSDMNSRGLGSESPPSNPPPPVRSFTSPVPNPSTIQPFDRTASPRPPNQGGYVAFNPRSLANNNTNPSGQNSGPFSAAPSSIVRPATTAPTYNANFNAHQEIVRAATTTPSNGLVRNQHFGAAPQHHYPPAHNEDDDEYDPLSYYGTAK